MTTFNVYNNVPMILDMRKLTCTKFEIFEKNFYPAKGKISLGILKVSQVYSRIILRAS